MEPSPNPTPVPTLDGCDFDIDAVAEALAPQLAENSGSICSECFGSGWVTDTKSELDFGFNFKFTICKKCNGTGFL